MSTGPMTTCTRCWGEGMRLADVGHCKKCGGTGELETPAEPCRDCKGTGKFVTKSGFKVPCRTCKGTGKFKVREYLEAQGRLADFKPRVCGNCRGTGKLYVLVTCETCNKTGKVSLNQLQNYLPDGIDEMIAACSSLRA